MATGTELRNLAQTLIDEPVTRGPTAQGFLGGLGASADEQSGLDRDVAKMRQTAGTLMQAVSLRYGITVVPTAGDTERLRRLGAAKGLARYATETDAQFEARIDSAIDDATELGTVAAIERELKAFGLVDVLVIEECYTPFDAPGSTYAFRFLIVLGPNYGALGWKPLTLPFKLGTPTILGIAGATSAQLSDFVRIVRSQKTGASKPVAIVFRFGDFPVLGCGLKLPFKFGGSSGSSYSRRAVGEACALGKISMPFKLGMIYYT